MKRQFSGLARMLLASAGVLWFTACETEADDAATNVVPASASAELSGTNRTGSAVTNLAAIASTNDASVTNAAGTNITNEQVVIINKVEPTLPPNLKLSRGVEEIVKLAQSGVSETVMLLFVEKSEHSFDLGAAEIVYLNDIGVPQTVIAAMLNHDGATTDVASILATNTVEVATAPVSTNVPPPPPAIPSSGLGGGLTPQPAPQVVEVSSNYVADPNYQAPVIVQQQPVVVEQPVVVQQPVIVQPAVTHSYFYSSLAPYGTWVEVADYGWCWQPTIAVRHHGWRPYAHGGRWLYSNHGWYWHSDYSWGWAPFHYGRWYAAPRHGWVWVPGYTWGPSWVTWRYSGSYCGWAPLPPRCDPRPGGGFHYWGRDVGVSFSFGLSYHHYTFVPSRRFADRRPIDHVVPTEKTVNIYKDSTVVNNYIVGNNNTIINQGIGRDHIASHTRSEIPRVQVQEAAAAPGSGVQPDRIVRRGSEMVVYRPPAPPTADAAATSGGSRRGSQEAGRFTPANQTAANAPASANGPSRFGNGRSDLSTIPSATRPITDRSQIAARAEPPPMGTPAPIRPEPAPAFTPRVEAARAAQESRFGNRTEAGAPLRPQSSSRFPASVADSSRPSAPPGAAASTPATVGAAGPARGSRFSTQPAMPPSISGQSVPGTPAANVPTYTASSSRFSTPAAQPSISGQAAPAAPQTAQPSAQRPITSTSRFGGSAPAMPPSISGQQVPGAPATTPSITSRPVAPTAAPSSRFGSTPPAMPPSISGQQVPGAPASVPSTPGPSRFGRSDFSAQSAPQVAPQAPIQQPTIAAQPRPLPGNSRFGNQQPIVANPPPAVSRSERFSQPAPAQMPPPAVSQPQRVTPVQRAPVYNPQPQQNSRFGGGVPSPSAPVAAPPAAVQSGPSISGSRFGGPPPPAASQSTVIHRTPPSAPAPAPSAPPQTQSGRGRIEIGR